VMLALSHTQTQARKLAHTHTREENLRVALVDNNSDDGGGGSCLRCYNGVKVAHRKTAPKSAYEQAVWARQQRETALHYCYNVRNARALSASANEKALAQQQNKQKEKFSCCLVVVLWKYPNNYTCRAW